MTEIEIPNRGQIRPHLLHLKFEVVGYGRQMSYRIECPHEGDGAGRPCAAWEECVSGDPRCTEHMPPPEPNVPEPQGKYSDGRMHYPEGTNPEHIRLWNEWEAANDQWNDDHPNGPHHPTDECWVQQFVAEGYEDGFELARTFDEQPIISPVKVHWENTGQIDDSYLVLHPWEDVHRLCPMCRNELPAKQHNVVPDHTINGMFCGGSGQSLAYGEIPRIGGAVEWRTTQS